VLALEVWLVLAVSAALVTAGIAQRLALGIGERPWACVALCARLAATAVVAVTLGQLSWALGQWTPDDLRLVALSLAMSAMIIYLTLGRFVPTVGTGPRLCHTLLVEGVALALVVVGVLVLQPRQALPGCSSRTFLFYVQWLLYLIGSGGVIVAGSAGLGLVLCSLPIQQKGRSSPCDALHASLGHAGSLALSTLGAGLVLGVWSAWYAVGRMSSGDPREAWLAVTWFVSAMSGLVRGWTPGSQRWAGVLALLAAAVVTYGLLLS
jgi:hypothetical protein